MRATLQRLGRLAYSEAFELQEAHRRLMLEDSSVGGKIFFVEHPPTLTLGRGEDGSSFLHPQAWYTREGITIAKTNRGGKITYHGPGQWVCYPVIRLTDLNLGVKSYVREMEEIMILVAARLGVNLQRREGFPGVWQGLQKFGALGIHVRRQVSIHGFALNVQTQESHFASIRPCGLDDVSSGSLSRALGRDVSLDEVYDVGEALLQERWHLA